MKREQHYAAGVGARVRSLRKGRQMTQEDLAERSGLTSEAVTRVERGTRKPTIDTLSKLAHGLGVDVTDLLGSGDVVPATPTMSEHLRKIVSQLEHQDAVVQEGAAEIIGAFVRTLRKKAKESAKALRRPSA